MPHLSGKALLLSRIARAQRAMAECIEKTARWGLTDLNVQAAQARETLIQTAKVFDKLPADFKYRPKARQPQAGDTVCIKELHAPKYRGVVGISVQLKVQAVVARSLQVRAPDGVILVVPKSHVGPYKAAAPDRRIGVLPPTPTLRGDVRGRG